MAEMIRVLNTHNGNVGWVLKSHFNHPAFNKYLVEYGEDKPPVAELFKAREPEEFTEDQERKRGRKAAKETAVVEVESETKADETEEI